MLIIFNKRTDLWLNEGFATWIQYLSIDKCFPEWNVWSFYPTEIIGEALDFDSLRNSHPVQMRVCSPGDLPEIFDSISYCKGSCIIRMLNCMMGDEAFRDALRGYFQKFQYKNTITQDLWASLSEKSDQDIQNLMNNWTKSAGYPLVSVSLEQNKTDGCTWLCLSQRRYFKNSTQVIVKRFNCNNDDNNLYFAYNLKESSLNELWKIPIFIDISLRFFKNSLLEDQYTKLNLGKLSPEQRSSIFVNPKIVGFYRVLYSKEMFDSLLASANLFSSNAAAEHRIGFISDTFALTCSNHLSSYDLFRLLWVLRNEKCPHVWKFLLDNVHILLKRLVDTHLFEQSLAFFSILMQTIVAEIGFEEGEDDGD